MAASRHTHRSTYRTGIHQRYSSRRLQEYNIYTALIKSLAFAFWFLLYRPTQRLLYQRRALESRAVQYDSAVTNSCIAAICRYLYNVAKITSKITEAIWWSSFSNITKPLMVKCYGYWKRWKALLQGSCNLIISQYRQKYIANRW